MAQRLKKTNFMAVVAGDYADDNVRSAADYCGG